MLAFLLEVFGVLISGLSAAAAGRLGVVTSRGKRLWPSWGGGCFASLLCAPRSPGGSLLRFHASIARSTRNTPWITICRRSALRSHIVHHDAEVHAADQQRQPCGCAAPRTVGAMIAVQGPRRPPWPRRRSL